MAALSSFAGSGVTYTEDFGTGIASITGGVLTINGALDALDDRIHTIECSASGGIRSTSGASGTLRATGGRTLNIIERSNAHRYGADNGKQSNSNGSGARFAGDATNTLVYEKINWSIEAGGRTDFDFGAGTNANGSLGAGVTMRGVYVNIEAETAGANNNFPHLWSSNTKLEIDPELGYGLRMANHTQSHGLLIEVQPNAQFAGLVVDDISAVASGGGRVVVSPPNNTTYTLFNLNTPDITESNGSGATGNKTILVDPVGLPTRSNNWGGYYSTMEVQRTIRFNFTGAVDATGTLVALHQNSNSEAADATGTIAANGAGSVRVKTNISASSGSTGAWTSLDGFQFYATSRGFRKYYSGATTINVGNAPTTRAVSVTADQLPDGTALTAYTGTGGADTASEIYRIIKDHELANPTHRTLGASLAVIDASGNIVVDSTVSLQASTTQTPLSAWDSNTSTLTIKVVSGVTADAGINSLNFGNRALPALQAAYFAMPITTSAGTSSVVLITGASDHFTGVYKADGTPLGSHTFTANGYAPAVLVSAADSAANTSVVYAMPGRTCQTQVLNLAAGGVYRVNFGDLSVERDQDGNPLYDATATLTGLTASFASNGQCTLEIPDATATIKQLYKAFQDGLATEAGGAFCALGHQLLGISQYAGQVANLTLGPDIQLRRAASSGNNAAVAAVPSGGINGEIVNDDRGEVLFLPSSGGGGGSTDLTGVNAKLDSIIEANEHIATSLPITFPEGSPLSPLVVICGLAGQSIIRDVESRGYPITPTGVGLDTDARGIMTFGGTNSHIDLSLERVVDGVATNHTTEIIALMQVKPTAFNATDAQPLFSIGAALVSIAPSSGSTAALRVGVAGAQDTTELLTLNEFNTIVVSFQQRTDAPNYPIIRVSINGAAQQKWNDGSNELFAQIASSTTNFRIGARSTGGNTSVGFIGEARALWVHPNNKIFNSGAGWDIDTGIYWSELHQLYLGAHLADRVEGVLSDVYEPIVDEIAAKTFTLEEQASAVLRQPFSAGINAGNSSTSSLTEFTKWLAANVNTTTPPTAAAIATEVGAPSASTIATAVRDVSNASPAANSLGAAVNAVPTAADNADAIWDEALSGHTADGSAGKRLGETSTHGAPADAPAATDVAQAVRDIALTGAAANSLGAKLASLSNGPTAAAIRDAINAQIVSDSVTRLQKERLELSAFAGTFTLANGRVQYVEPGTTRAILSADVTDAARSNVSLDFDD